MRKLSVTRDAMKYVDGLAAKQYRQVVRRIFGLLQNPQPHDSSQLKGYEYWRVDQGEYRIIYKWDEEVVYVAVVDLRNDDAAYKRLKGR
jgi:mRNA interferase RelE/StbE